MKDFNFELDYLMVQRTKDRVPAGGVMEMHVNDYIASVTDQLNAPGSINIPGLREDLTKVIGMFSFLRDTYQASKVAEVYQCLSQRRVDSKIVDLWVHEDFALILDGFADAIIQGYPEHKVDLEELRKRFMEETFAKWQPPKH